MEEKIVLGQAVLVEGKYDKIHLESILDAFILPVNGFRLYKNTELKKLIGALAKSCGIVILTDSDAAGFQLRRRIGEMAAGGSITQVYIPDVMGKERRKASPGKEGKLGVEGIEPALLRKAFEQAGLICGGSPAQGEITRQDLFEAGLMGGQKSSGLRRELLVRLGLPARLSTSAMLPVLNRLVQKEELLKAAKEIQEEMDTAEKGL